MELMEQQEVRVHDPNQLLYPPTKYLVVVV